jgi:serine/threonine-protein phosphatase PPG1
MPGLPASVDLDECISRLYKKELLAESVIEAICAKTKELLMRESNVVHVRAPVTVVGDIHGQFFDLIEIFKIGGWCPDTNYLFLGAHTLGPTRQNTRGARLAATTTCLTVPCLSSACP